MPGKHALLSASSAHKWMNCTPSARLEEMLPDKETEYMKEGTLAHAIAELKLTKHFTPMGPQTYTRRLNKLKLDPLYATEMDTHTDTYTDFVKAQALSYKHQPSAVIESKLDYSAYAPEGFGTADCILIGGGMLDVIDFKYGQGVAVSAERNPQMLLYALGALDAYGAFCDVQTVRLSIVQPRIGNTSTWCTTAAELREWGENIKPIAEQAFAGDGETRAGAWCMFCKAKGSCRARAATNMELAKLDLALPPQLSNGEVAELLPKLDSLVKWAEDIRAYALDELLAGREIPGYKAVEGRSNRAFTDVDTAFTALTSKGYDEAMLYERRPITLSAVEKLLGKKTFEELLGEYVHKPQGKPALAPESDRRETFKQIQIQNDFGGNQEWQAM